LRDAVQITALRWLLACVDIPTAINDFDIDVLFIRH
jgi:hypothetical protein